MVTGFFSNGQCLATFQQATDTHWDSIEPELLISGSTTIIHQAERLSSGAWVHHKYELSTSGAMTDKFSIPLPPLYFGSCDIPYSDPVQSFQDGAIIGWGIAAAMAAAWAIHFLRRAL